MNDFFDRVRDDHHQFGKGKLEQLTVDQPLELFTAWLQEATAKNASEPNAMSVSTVDENGIPSSRIVYLKELYEGGFVFYTNYHSDKGKAIAANPVIHLLFFWPELERQVSITGTAEKVPAAMSDAYFASRPKSSQVGAIASHQSEVLESRQELEARIEALLAQYPGAVPRPDNWGGYVVKPVKIEFWQGRSSRLHDRIVFEATAGSWAVYRKNP